MSQPSAFGTWMRTGRNSSGAVEHKFNPWHDPDDGRFTLANQGRWNGSGGSVDTSRMTNPPPRPSAPIKPAPVAARRPAPTADIAARERETQEREVFKKHVAQFEGDRDDVYPDSKGIPTVGIGHRVVPADKLKVGDRISPARKEAFWRADSAKALSAAKAQMRLAGINDDDPFLAPLASVNLQLGTAWKNDHKVTWALIKAGKYAAAAREAQNSKWFADTPTRVRAFQSELLKLEARKRATR